MSSSSLRILLVEDDTSYAELVQDWLSTPSADYAFDLIWTDTLGVASKRLSHGDIHIVLLDLGLPDSNGLATFTRLRAVEPTLPFIILSGSDNECLALENIQQGAQDYLVKASCTRETLVRAIRYAHIRHSAQRSQIEPDSQAKKCRVIGLLGSKGGVGVTTVACTLAEELYSQTHARLLLADLDIYSTSTAFLLGVDCRYSLADLTNNLDRLDAGLFETLASNESLPFRFLSSPGPSRAGECEPNALQQVIESVRTECDWIIADLGRLDVLSVQFLQLMTEFLLVTTTSVPALHSAKCVLQHLESCGLVPGRVHLIINKTDKDQYVQGSDVAKLVGTDVFAQLPLDPEAIQTALLRKRLPADSSSFRRGVRELASRLAGTRIPAPRGLVPRLLSLLIEANRSAAPLG